MILATKTVIEINLKKYTNKKNLDRAIQTSFV